MKTLKTAKINDILEELLYLVVLTDGPTTLDEYKAYLPQLNRRDLISSIKEIRKHNGL